jgi:hypothetical protein
VSLLLLLLLPNGVQCTTPASCSKAALADCIFHVILLLLSLLLLLLLPPGDRWSPLCGVLVEGQKYAYLYGQPAAQQRHGQQQVKRHTLRNAACSRHVE